jgi:hypothetical protein
MGATLKRRDGSGCVDCGFETDSRDILVYALLYHFSGNWSVFGVAVVRCTTLTPLVPPKIMATIRARKKADGAVSYTVQIRLKKKGVLVYQEAQTFARKQAAQA